MEVLGGAEMMEIVLKKKKKKRSSDIYAQPTISVIPAQAGIQNEDSKVLLYLISFCADRSGFPPARE